MMFRKYSSDAEKSACASSANGSPVSWNRTLQLLSLGAARISELKEAADRLASALADVDEEELVAEFKELRRRGKGASR